MRNFFPQILSAPEMGAGSEAVPAADTPSTSTPSSASPGLEDASSFSNDFSGLSGDDYVADEDSQAAVTVAPPPPVTAAPTSVQSEQPKPTPTPPSVQPAQPAVAPVETQPTQPVVESAPAQTVKQPQNLGELMKLFTENENDLVAALADTSFKLSPEDIQALEVDAVSVVPKLLARGQIKTMQGMMQIMQTEMPRMIQQQVTTMARQMQAEQTFFQQFPTLSREKHGEDIRSIGKLLAERNPQLPQNELLTLIGRTVAGMHGLGLTPAQPAAPVRTIQQQPFAPAINSPRVVATQHVPDGNDFGFGLAQDYDDN